MDHEVSGTRAGQSDSDSGDDLDRGAASEGDSERTQREDASDTARIAQSVTEYARRCLITGAFSKALVALQSAVEIAEMPSLAYRQSVLQTAQVLRAAHEFEASVTCMQLVYRHMPTPYTYHAGVLIIARLYEEMQRWDCARFWRKKLGSAIYHGDDRLHPLWIALGDQAFEQQDFVFAADFYAQSQGDAGEDPRTIYRLLLSLTQFTGPCAALHRQQRQLTAWRLAQRFQWDRSRYGDTHYWRLRELYARFFPAIYRAVFGWDEVFARRIACWWKARHSSAEDAVVGVVTSEEAPADTREDQPTGGNHVPLYSKGATQGKTQRRRQRLAAASAAVAVELPPRTRHEQRYLPKRGSPSRCAARGGMHGAKPTNNSEATDPSGPSVASGSQERGRRPLMGRSVGASQAISEFFEASPTKRKLGVVRRLRKQRLSDDVRLVSPLPAVSDDSTPASLLELYPRRVPYPDEAFLLTAGRKPGLADLDVHELAEFARLAHYRARVIAAQRAKSSALDLERVRPRWLVAFDRAVDFLADFNRSKQRLEDDSIAHLAEIHARLVFQLSAIRRQYASEFGTTAFTLALQSLTHQLATWRFQRIAELTGALATVKSVGVNEEKRRSLEFYHVHRREEERAAIDGRSAG